MLNRVAGKRNVLMAIMVLCATPFVIVGCSDTSLTDAEYVQRAKDHYDEGDLSASIIELKNALRINPDNLEGRWTLGRIYLEQGDGASAEKELRRALDLGLVPESAEVALTRALLLQGKNQEVVDRSFEPDRLPEQDRAELIALRADAYFALDKLDTANELYNRALAVNAQQAEAQLGKARLAIIRNDLKGARQLVSSVLDSQPDFAPALSLLGILETWDKNLEQAEAAYTKAMKDPAYAITSQYRRAFLRIEQNKLDEAAQDIKELKKRLRQAPTIEYAEGLLSFTQGDYTEAQRYFEQVIGAVPNHAPALFYAGATHAILGNSSTAASYLTRHLSLNPGSLGAQRLLALVELKSGNPEEAKQLAEAALQSDPGDLLTMSLLADASLALGNEEAVVGYRRRAVESRPDSPAARVLLGNTLVNMGDVEAGLRELEQVLELHPGEHRAAQSLVQQHLRLGNADAALEAAREHLERQPRAAPAHTLLGLVHLSRKEVEEARKAFAQALEINPGDVSAYHAMALMAIQDEDLDGAKNYYLEALKHRPGDIKTLVNLANLHAMQGDQVARKQVLEQAIAAHPNELAPRILLGRTYLTEGEAGKAIELVEELRRQYPGDKDLFGLLAEAQLADGRFDQAKETLSRLRELAPQDARVHYVMAATLQQLNDRSGMRTALEKAVALDPEFVPAAIGLARLAIEDRDLDAAQGRVDALRARVADDNPELIQLEAQLAALKGDWTEAVNGFQRLFDMAPTGFNLRQLSQARWNAGDEEKAVGAYEQWLKDRPDDVGVMLELSARYLAQGRTDEAVANYQKLLERAPDNVLALNNLASLIGNRDPDAALDYAQRAYDLVPESPAVMDTLAGALLRKGETRMALSMIERALAKRPNNPSFLYHHAQILEADGQREEAIKVLDNVLKENPAFGERKEAEALQARLRSSS